MIGVALSRWTMLYFAAALLALVLGEGLMVAGFGYPSAAVQAPETLFLVHLFAIGWLSFLLLGALFQFVPVLVAKSLYADELPLPTLALLLAGLALLLAGFLQLGGHLGGGSLLPWGAALLAAGFLLAIYNLGRTLWSARPLILPAQFVVVALLSLVATFSLGFVFTLALGSVVPGGIVAEITALGLPLHIIAALGGWLTFTAMGVSYRLLAMFMLAPELNGRRPHFALWLGTAALVVAIGGGLALLLSGRPIAAALALALLLGLGSAGLYGADVRYLYRKRRRPIIELNSRMAAYAVGSLLAGLVLLLAVLAFGSLAKHAGAVVFLFAFGWLSGLGLAKLYKITAFLSWLECYGPILGRKPTPRVQDLAVEPHALRWFYGYFAAVWLATLALLLAQPLWFRACAAVMLVCTLAIIGQLWRIRRLADVKESIRLADLVAAPRLLQVLPRHDG